MCAASSPSTKAARGCCRRRPAVLALDLHVRRRCCDRRLARRGHLFRDMPAPRLSSTLVRASSAAPRRNSSAQLSDSPVSPSGSTRAQDAVERADAHLGVRLELRRLLARVAVVAHVARRQPDLAVVSHGAGHSAAELLHSCSPAAPRRSRARARHPRVVMSQYLWETDFCERI